MRLFDSAQAYGAGHSEVGLGKALTFHPDVTVVTKFGWAIDTQAKTLGWMAYFQDGKIKDTHLAQLNGVRDVLTSGGRPLAQGAIPWLWARSPSALPIPGFRTPEQVTDLCGALDHGPLTPQQMAEIETILDRPPEGPPTAR